MFPDLDLDASEVGGTLEWLLGKQLWGLDGKQNGEVEIGWLVCCLGWKFAVDFRFCFGEMDFASLILLKIQIQTLEVIEIFFQRFLFKRDFCHC